ncbi:MAG: hypothetical protein ISS93_02010 [Candidatus Aenigmarchaeota archaeon]|nr:hypothetical protein [Candidatus Aenigmarchaeota archaeon]
MLGFRKKEKRVTFSTPEKKPNKKTESAKSDPKPASETFDSTKVKSEIEKKLKGGEIEKKHADILKQRAPVKHVIDSATHKKAGRVKQYIKTGIPGFDQLLEKGIPKGYAVIVAGGAGSGKTIFCLQTLMKKASDGKKCIYMSFEESEERLKDHIEEFGWDADSMIKSGNLVIKRFNPFEITRSVDALLMKAKGELLIDMEPLILPKGFRPDVIALDSLTAIASAFTGKEESYRAYIEQLFRFFERIEANAFLITETKQVPTIFSQTGVEEFLADGVVVIYNIKRGNVRERAIEMLKLRGARHEEKIVAMEITENGIVVYPNQQVFGEAD